MILLDEQLSREPAELATPEEAIEIIGQLEFELKQSKIRGVGLAAPQIGIAKAVAIVRINTPAGHINLVNPKLVAGHDLIEYEEGCLSFPGQSVKTIRYNEIVVETMSDYKHYSEQLNSERYGRDMNEVSVVSNSYSSIYFGADETDHPQLQQIDQLISICIQHELAHLIGLDFRDFQPKEVGRNDKCPVHPEKKSKKCCGVRFYNSNLQQLFNPNYRSPQ